MGQMVLEPVPMEPAWQVMVSLALDQPVAARLLPCDWEGVKEFTLKNNLAVLVHAGVQHQLPPEYRNQPRMIEIRLLSKLQRLQSQNQAAALGELLEAFQEAEIPVLSFKGPLLSQELYGDASMRNSCDLDILVDGRDLSRACRCLQNIGYETRETIWDSTPKRQKVYRRRNPQMHRVFRRREITVELHWRICYRFDVPFQTLWETRQQAAVSGHQANVLSPEENLCYLITHGAGHGYRQLRWLLEIYTLLEREHFEVSQLYAKMKQRGVALLLLETLLLLYRLSCFEMPGMTIRERETPLLVLERRGTQTVLTWKSSEKREVEKANRLVTAVIPLLRRNNPAEGLDGRIYKRLLPVLEKRTPFLLTLLEPCTADLEWVDLPDNLFFLYYFLRPVHFLLRAGRKKRSTATENGGKPL